MTEHDAFELRLAAAVRSYAGRVSSELDPVELAHRIAAREPRRRGLGAALTWRGVAIPRGAWVLLLLGALLTGLVAGMVAVGTRPPELPAVVPIDQVYACPPGSTPNKPGPVDQARPVDPEEFGSPPLYSTLAVVDSRAGRLVAVIDTGIAVETWTFDVCRNVWIQMHPAVEPPRFEWGQLVYDADSDVTILADSSGSIWAYDLLSDTWTSMGPNGVQGGQTYMTLWAYDPLTGLVVAGTADGAGPWRYAVETNTWTPIPGPDVPVGGPAVYDASVDRIVFPGQGLFDLRTGAWSSTQAEMPLVIAGYGMSSPAFVYDESAHRTVAIGNQRLAAYDATADRWEIVLDLADFLPLPVAYDPVNKRLIGLGRGGVGDYGGVVALDLATRTWTVLLAASDGEAPPTPR